MKMKFNIQINITAEVAVEDITTAKVIQDLSSYANRAELMDDDLSFEIGAKNQRLLDLLRADRALLLQYAKLRALLEAFRFLEESNNFQTNADEELEKIEQSLIGGLTDEDAKWFRGAIDEGLWIENTEHFSNAFVVDVAEPSITIEGADSPE